MTLGQKLKKLRTEKGITQKDLSDQLHVTFQTVSKWESDTNEPDIATIKELAKFFGCSFNYLLSDEEETKEDVAKEPVVVATPVEVVTKTIVVHQNDLHVCARCGKDIPENELVSEDITKRERHGRITQTVTIGQTFYHKQCLEEVKKERAEAARREKIAQASKSKKKCFGWGIAAAAIVLAIGLVISLMNSDPNQKGLGILYTVIGSYVAFSMIYCILSGSYIGDVFTWCAGLTIKFPGLIFSWDLGGFIWLIGMKILFAILGFLVGVAALLLAIVLSGVLSCVSFPFVLIHNIRTGYEDAF